MNKLGQTLVIFGNMFLGKKKLGVKISDNLELIRTYEVLLFFIPLLFSKRIMLYDFSTNKRYEFSSKLERRLLELGKEANPQKLSQTIKQYEKEEKHKLEYNETHKEEIEKKDNDDFIRMLKAIGIIAVIIILGFIIKGIFFKQ